MHLELDGAGSLRSQLTRALRSAIRDQRLGSGARLPATRNLAAELGLSRNTVLAAYEQLRLEGYVKGRTGSGSYLIPELLKLPVQGVRQRELPAQSDFAARGRQFHDHQRIPGRPIEGVIHSFQYGVPLINATLTTAWSRELARAAAYTSPGYPPTQGLLSFRQAICDYLARRRGVNVMPESVLIIAGTQQGLSLSARVLVNPGQCALVEQPHYFALREVLQIHGANVMTAPVDANGLQVDKFPEDPPRLICATPAHQFPTGVRMSLERRASLLDYASHNDCWIFEDDYDGEFRYDSKPLAALLATDKRDRVIYVGSFSKAMFPSLRLGYLVMPSGLERDFINAKWQDDFGTSAVEQAAMASFMESGGFERHLRRAWKTLRERREVLIAGLRLAGRGRLQISDSHAGMHLVAWLQGRTEDDCERLIGSAKERGLGLYSIAPFFLGQPNRVGLLFGYCGMSIAQINDALDILAVCLDEVLSET